MAQRQTGKRSLFSFKHLSRQLFGLSSEEASFARRGFHSRDQGVRQRLELIGCTFLQGYHSALEEADVDVLVNRLNTLDAETRGFAFEGAAMGLALLDLMTPWKRDRWQEFVQNGAEAHRFMVHVGAGWALARLQPWFKKHPSLSDPLLRWLTIDGYAFHEGYFHWPRFVQQRALPNRLSGYALRVFDQGLGRSIWFVDGADVERIPQTIAAFQPSRRADLWSGVGLACAYAGGLERDAVESLRAAAHGYTDALAQGAAFAAKARQKARNPAAHTEVACEVLCGLSLASAARVTDDAVRNLPLEGELPAYEIWRSRTQNYFAERDARA